MRRWFRDKYLAPPAYTDIVINKSRVAWKCYALTR
jgi:hypothetical protein